MSPSPLRFGTRMGNQDKQAALSRCYRLQTRCNAADPSNSDLLYSDSCFSKRCTSDSGGSVTFCTSLLGKNSACQRLRLKILHCSTGMLKICLESKTSGCPFGYVLRGGYRESQDQITTWRRSDPRMELRRRFGLVMIVERRLLTRSRERHKHFDSRREHCEPIIHFADKACDAKSAGQSCKFGFGRSLDSVSRDMISIDSCHFRPFGVKSVNLP